MDPNTINPTVPAVDPNAPVQVPATTVPEPIVPAMPEPQAPVEPTPVIPAEGTGDAGAGMPPVVPPAAV